MSEAPILPDEKSGQLVCSWTVIVAKPPRISLFSSIANRVKPGSFAAPSTDPDITVFTEMPPQLICTVGLTLAERECEFCNRNAKSRSVFAGCCCPDASDKIRHEVPSNCSGHKGFQLPSAVPTGCLFELNVTVPKRFVPVLSISGCHIRKLLAIRSASSPAHSKHGKGTSLYGQLQLGKRSIQFETGIKREVLTV